MTPPLALAYATTPRALWREVVNEQDAADPYSVLRIYGGPPMTWHPLLRMNVQCQTVASSEVGDEAGLERASILFQTLLAADGKPIRMQSIPGFHAADNSADGTWLLHHVDPLQRPGFTGRDDRGRALAGWNFEVGFYKTS
jgi:hypothetical protein